MQQVKVTSPEQDILCAETQAQGCGFVVFGASGDLVQRKLLASIFQLYKRGLLSEKFFFLGCGRTKFSDQQYRQAVDEDIKDKTPDKADREKFLNMFFYQSGDYDDAALYAALKKRIAELDGVYKTEGNIVYYLAVPPFLYTTIVDRLGSSGLSCGDDNAARAGAKLVVEKPFGRDLKSAMDLDERIHGCFDESRIYRIDHYLGKETVQNILFFRFANSIFEPIWNRNFIDHVQITAAESIGVENRGSYYDKTGVLRDMFQNHMLQMMTLAAMEAPTSFDAECIRDEKIKLLRSIRPFDISKLDKLVVRGQYSDGVVNGNKVEAYRNEPDVDRESKTETFAAAKFFIDNWRWKDVPFYLRSGKGMKNKNTEIAITFKKMPHSMFVPWGIEEMPPNVLILRIQPEEGIALSFQAKRPGSKLCIGPLAMDFNYADIFGVSMPEAYQRLLLDCMAGDQTLFIRHDAVEVSWKLITPILESQEKEPAEPYFYPAGAESFAAADNLMESDGRKWRKIV